MKLEIPNLKELLDNHAKPIANFVSANAIDEPIMKIWTGSGKLLLECSSHDRSITTAIDATVKSEGELYIMAKAIASLRSSYKNAILTSSNGKFKITGGDANRRLVLNIDTVDKNSYTSVRVPKTKMENLGKFPLAALKQVTSKMNITPILVVGNSRALISISPEKEGFKAIVNDDNRVIMYEAPKSNIKFRTKLITDFKELQSIVDIISSVSEKASFDFTKKAIMAKGFDENNTKIMDVKLNYSLLRQEYTERALSVIKTSMKAKTRMGFICEAPFLEILNNGISLTNMKSKSAAGYVDITVKGTTATVSGMGPSSSYRESIKISKAMGKGVVRINSNVLSDITRLFAPKSLFKVTQQSIIITNKWKDHTVYFILPFLTFSGTPK